MECSQCQTQNPDTNNFCLHCGHRMVEGPLCAGCYQVVDMQVETCPHCGYRFQTNGNTPIQVPTVATAGASRQGSNLRSLLGVGAVASIAGYVVGSSFVNRAEAATPAGNLAADGSAAPSLFSIDYNGDGAVDGFAADVVGGQSLDTIIADLDGNGITDAIGMDFDEDGLLDAIGLDTNEDGNLDAFGFDTSGTGQMDAVAFDVDENGSLDVLGGDSNLDGSTDWLTADTDLNGEFDLAAVDFDGNNMIGEGEFAYLDGVDADLGAGFADFDAGGFDLDIF